jgi:outer membrane receptor protein involved in Fe transport
VLAAGAASTAATDDIFSILEEELIVVSSGRVGQKQSETTLSVEVITAEEIRNSGIELLPELLRRYAGMDVAQTTFSDFHVSIRGDVSRVYAADKVLLLIDGRPMTHDAYGSVPWNNLAITLDIIERIEIVRGPGTSMYGGSGVMGVVNIISKTTQSRSAAAIRFGAGTFFPSVTGNFWPVFSLRTVQAAISDDGKHEVSLSLGPYSVINDPQGVYELRSPSATTHGLYTYHASRTQRLSINHYITGSGRNFIHSTADVAPATDRTGMMLIGAEYVVDPQDDKDWSMQARASFAAVPYFGVPQQTALTGARSALSLPLPIGVVSELLFRVPLPQGHSLSVGADGRFFALRGGALQTGGRLAIDASLFAIDQARLRSWLLLEAAMRVGVRAYPSGAAPAQALLSPRLGFSIPFHPQHSLRVSAAYSQRPPSPLELFGTEQLPFLLQGNPSLRPEGLVSLDFGYELRIGSFSAGVTPYVVFYQNLRARSGSAPQIAVNQSSFIGAGGEVTATYKPVRGMEVRGNYSLALYTDGGRLTATGPAHKANVVFDTELPFGFGLNIAGGYISRGDYYGPRADTFPNPVLTQVPDRFFVDLSLRYLHNSGIGFQLSGQNLNRGGTLLRAEYPALGAQPVAPRVMLALSYDTGPRAGVSGGWSRRVYGQICWALVGLSLIALPIALPFAFRTSVPAPM